jgi:hypothetical protein
MLNFGTVTYTGIGKIGRLRFALGSSVVKNWAAVVINGMNILLKLLGKDTRIVICGSVTVRKR